MFRLFNFVVEGDHWRFFVAKKFAELQCVWNTYNAFCCLPKLHKNMTCLLVAYFSQLKRQNKFDSSRLCAHNLPCQLTRTLFLRAAISSSVPEWCNCCCWRLLCSWMRLATYGKKKTNQSTQICLQIWFNTHTHMDRPDRWVFSVHLLSHPAHGLPPATKKGKGNCLLLNEVNVVWFIK